MNLPGKNYLTIFLQKKMSDINDLWRGLVSGSLQNTLTFLAQTNIEKFIIFLQSENLINNSNFESNRIFQNGINTRDLSKVSQALYTPFLNVDDKDGDLQISSILRFGNFYKNKIGRREWDSKLDQNDKLISKIERFRIFFELCNQVILARNVNSHLHEPRNDSGWAMLLLGQIYRLLELDSAKKLSEGEILEIKNHGNRLLKEILTIENLEKNNDLEDENKINVGITEENFSLKEELVNLKTLIENLPEILKSNLNNLSANPSDANIVTASKNVSPPHENNNSFRDEDAHKQSDDQDDLYEEFKVFEKDLLDTESNELIGIGVKYRRNRNGGLKITSIYNGGAVSNEPNLKIGTEIVGIEENDIKTDLRKIPFDSAEQISSLLLGKEGTEVTVSVISDGDESEYPLIRKDYEKGENNIVPFDGINEASSLLNENQTQRELLIIRNKIKKKTKCKNWENVLQRSHIDTIIDNKISNSQIFRNQLEGMTWYEKFSEKMNEQIEIYRNEIDAVLNRSSWD